MKKRTKARAKKRAPLEAFPTPHAAQKEILALPGRFKIAICGRRFGKNVVASIMAKDTAKEGKHVLWIEPTDDQSKIVQRDFETFLAKSPDWTWHKSDREWHHKSGGFIRFRSAQAGSLRGPGYDLVIIDEAADVRETAWRLEVLPTLAERHGRAILMGTPKGKSNWLHRQFEHAACDPKWSRYHAPSSANPAITAEELEAMRGEMTELEFRQEFEAEFLDGAQSMFPGIEDHLAGAARNDGARGARYANGIDVGQMHDWTVAIGINTRTNVAEALTRFNNKPWSVTEAKIRNHIFRFRGPGYVDATGIGSVLAENLNDVLKPYVFTTETRDHALRQLGIAWEHESIKICNEPQLIHELRCMEWQQTGEAPHTRITASTTTEHDDCVLALALAWQARQRFGDAGPTTRSKPFIQFG